MPRVTSFWKNAPRYVVEPLRVICVDQARAAIPRRIKRRFEYDEERSSIEDERARGERDEARMGYGQSRRRLTLDAKMFLDLDLCVARDFESFAKLIAKTTTVQIARDWLEHVTELTPAAGDDVDDRDKTKCPRKLLSAYMIVHHSDVVIGGSSAEERALVISSSLLVDALEALTAAAASCARLQSLSTLVGNFERRWCLFTADWKIWKEKDAVSLQNELVRIGVAMEASMLRVCGASALDDSVDLGDEERIAIRDAQSHDRALLRQKILMLAGDEAAKNFDEKIEEVRYRALNETPEKSHSSDAQKAKLERRREAREAMSERMADAINRDKERAKLDDDETLSSVELQKEQILHELMLDADWKLTASSETRNPLRDAFEEAMTRAFWELAYESLVGGGAIDVSIFRARIIEWKDAVIDDALSFDDLPTSQLEKIQSLLVDIDIENLISGIEQMERSPLQVRSALHLALERGCSVLRALCTEDLIEQLEAERACLITKIECANQEKEIIARHVVDSLAFLFAFRERLSKARYLKAANAAIDGLRQTLIRGDVDGFDYARERFLRRFSVQPGDECSVELCKLKFPRTCAWLEAVADDLPKIDAQFTRIGSTIERSETWRGMRLRSGLMPSDTKENVRLKVVDAELKPAAVMTVEGVVRIALARLISNRRAMEQEFYPETFEFDVERLIAMGNHFALLHLLAACAALSRQLGNGSTAPVVHRVALLIADDTATPDFDVIAGIIRENAPNNRDEESTISNVLRRLCSGDDPVAAAVVNALRSALIVRILFGFEDPRTDARVEAKLTSFADAARPLRERVDALVRTAAPLHNLSSRIHASVLFTLASDVISRVDDEI